MIISGVNFSVVSFTYSSYQTMSLFCFKQVFIKLNPSNEKSEGNETLPNRSSLRYESPCSWQSGVLSLLPQGSSLNGLTSEQLLTSARRKRARKAHPLATFMAVLLGVVVCMYPKRLRTSSQGL